MIVSKSLIFALGPTRRYMTNTLEEITQGVIFLGPTGNLQGTCNLFLLRSGKKITREKFIGVPTPTIVMKRVAEMALVEKQNEGQILKTALALL